MDLFDLTSLRSLVSVRNEQCVSLYMPTHRRGRDTQQDPIRFRNLVRQAEDTLVAHGVRRALAERQLQPAHELLQASWVWRQLSDGLAFFCSPDTFTFYRLPISFPEQLVVSHRFHVKPLIPLLVEDGQFLVLAVSQNHIRLLQCTRFTVDPVEVETLPQGLADALKYDHIEKQTQLHTASSPHMGRQPAIFHGHGGAAEENKDRILRYFHQIDEGLQQLLRDQHAPLVLAAVSYLQPIYRQANSYPHLLPKGIDGNPEEISAADLQARAWELVQPYFIQGREKALERYRHAAGTGLTSTRLDEIIPAARNGRVEVLFETPSEPQWGTVSPAGEVMMHSAQEPGDEDLLDTAAVDTLLNGGQVHTLEATAMPNGATVAALFRY